MVWNIFFYCINTVPSRVLESDKAIGLLKKDIVNLYGAKGEHIVKMNNDAVDSAIANLKEINYDKLKWLGLTDIEKVVEPYM
jgi:hypothetical protein